MRVLMVVALMLGCGAETTPADAAPGSDVGETVDAGRDASAAPDAALDAHVEDAGSVDASADVAPDAAPPWPALPDLSIGPYTSLRAMLLAGVRSNAASLDTGATYTHAAAQGYLLQAIAELLHAARDHELPEREELLGLALGEVAELEASADRTTGASPAFGLPDAWDAFGDGSTNPAYTAYVWQSGMVAYGVAGMARELAYVGDPRLSDVLPFAVALVRRWDAHRTTTPDGSYWWYSAAPADDIAVHNTSALLAMAHDALADATGDETWRAAAEDSSGFLWARLRGNPTTGYAWNYADDGYPVASRRAEDSSHALVTLQQMALAGERGWWPSNRLQGVSRTLLGNLWTGDPARLAGRVDGTRAGESEWAWTRASVIGWAAQGRAPGADPLVFDTACSIFFTSYLSRFERALEGGSLDAARTLALAHLVSRRPAAFANGTRWRRVASPGDDALPSDAMGGVRFYTVDWAAPADTARGLTLPARRATAANANLLVDLPLDVTGRVAVSLTYSSTVATNVAEWDGAAYRELAPLPATIQDDGVVRWARTTFELDPGIRHDYQSGVPGVNVLLQLRAEGVEVHALEATPL